MATVARSTARGAAKDEGGRMKDEGTGDLPLCKKCGKPMADGQLVYGDGSCKKCNRARRRRAFEANHPTQQCPRCGRPFLSAEPGPCTLCQTSEERQKSTAERLLPVKTCGGWRSWPRLAVKVLREWRASLAETPGTLKKKRETKPTPSAMRKEAQQHIERYLDTIGPAESAWEQSGFLLDALNQWRGRNKPKATSRKGAKARRKPR